MYVVDVCTEGCFMCVCMVGFVCVDVMCFCLVCRYVCMLCISVSVYVCIVCMLCMYVTYACVYVRTLCDIVCARLWTYGMYVRKSVMCVCYV